MTQNFKFLFLVFATVRLFFKPRIILSITHFQKSGLYERMALFLAWSNESIYHYLHAWYEALIVNNTIVHPEGVNFAGQ